MSNKEENKITAKELADKSRQAQQDNRITQIQLKKINPK